LKDIPHSALQPCKSLKSICFPASLESLPWYLFVSVHKRHPKGCSPVETITFEPGSKVRQIWGETFTGCESLKSLYIPASVEKISGSGFVTYRRIQIEIESGNPFFRVVGDFVMDSNSQKIVRYFGNDSEIDIPDSVETIGEDSFSNCRSAVHFLFGVNSKLSSIEYRSFTECGLLQSIYIPSLVTQIPDWCFHLCRSLRAVSFASDPHVRAFGSLSFSESGLESISLPSTITLLGGACFEGCGRLAIVMFPADSKLVRIESRAFYDCSSLGPICLPSSVEFVGPQCFSKCDSMTHLHFSVPCRVKGLWDLPPALSGVTDIPDSVEILEFSVKFGEDAEHALRFGSGSKLQMIHTAVKRSFLHFSSRMLKHVRSKREFPPSLYFRLPLGMDF
jgi:hypothetical protein